MWVQGAYNIVSDPWEHFNDDLGPLIYSQTSFLILAVVINTPA